MLGSPYHTFLLYPRPLAIARYAPETPVPAVSGAWFSVTRTPFELSIVCEEGHVPEGALKVEAGKMAFGIEGVLNMNQLGVISNISSILMKALVPVFVVSTYDTDWLIVDKGRVEAAKQALTMYGHKFKDIE